MPKRQGIEYEPLYKAARRWVEVGLASDGSLFTPGAAIWSLPWIEELHGRYVDSGIEGPGSFIGKLDRQLNGAGPDVVQLMAELLFVDYLVINKKAIRSKTKKTRIVQVLSMTREREIDIPEELVDALDGFGGSLLPRYRDQELKFLIRFLRQWKALNQTAREDLLHDPWAFKNIVWSVPVNSAYMLRNGLLHLVHPDTFEPITWRKRKREIAEALSEYVLQSSDDVDRQLAQIREALSQKYGKDFHFHDPEVRKSWETPPKNGSNGPAGDLPRGGKPSLHQLAEELHLTDDSHLERIVRLLEHRKQVIFYGPPGTGKTHVARELAAHLAGQEARAELVQFHPSYAYEDFVEGYRPTALEGGTAGFELREGPLKRMAGEAKQAPDETFVLIIDEINRGNLGKVLGELYFLLEYRKQHIKLQYSDKKFSLPDNLWIIGTMNTADRSIARIDSALRRRFHFVPFFPDEPPIKGLLARWLRRHKPEMAWVAEVLDRANQKLDRPHAAIGPSHFMHSYLDEEWVKMIWEHSVLPYIAEQYFGEDDRREEFALERLRSEATSAEGEDEQADGDAGERD